MIRLILKWKNTAADQQYRLWNICNCLCHWGVSWKQSSRCNLCYQRRAEEPFAPMSIRWFYYPIPSKPRKQKKPLVQSYSIFVSVIYLMYWSTNKRSLLIPKWMKLSYCDCCQTWYHFKSLQINHKSGLTYDDKEEWICDECATKFDLLSDDSD